MEDKKRVLFTEEMRKDYTILVPTMLPIHFRLICRVLNHYGYKAEVMDGKSEKIKEYGLKYVHNDACYPALYFCMFKTGAHLECCCSDRCNAFRNDDACYICICKCVIADRPDSFGERNACQICI